MIKPAEVALLLLPMVAARGPSNCFPHLEFPGSAVVQPVKGADKSIEARAREALQVARPGTIIQFPADNFGFDGELISRRFRTSCCAAGVRSRPPSISPASGPARRGASSPPAMASSSGTCGSSTEGLRRARRGCRRHHRERRRHRDRKLEERRRLSRLREQQHRRSARLRQSRPAVLRLSRPHLAPAQTEALLALGGGSKDVAWTAGDGTPHTTHSQIPNTKQCSRRHNGANGDEPIGPKAPLLNRDFDYGGGLVENQLAHWTDIGILAGAPVDPGDGTAARDAGTREERRPPGRLAGRRRLDRFARRELPDADGGNQRRPREQRTVVDVDAAA